MTGQSPVWRAALLGGLLHLAACGFHPLYGAPGSSSGPQSEMAAIDVALISDRPGQIMRQALQQRMDHGEALAKRYTLSVTFGVAADSIAVQRDSTATRIREVAIASWTLKALDQGGAVVISGTARALDGVNIIDQQYFAADLGSETATKRIVETLADQITLQVASYFARRPNTA